MTEVKEGAFVLQVRCCKLSPTMIFLSSWWNDYKKRKGSRPRSGRSGRKPICTCKCRSASVSHDPVVVVAPGRPAGSCTAPSAGTNIALLLRDQGLLWAAPWAFLTE